MASGLEILLKSMGFDMETIKAQATELAAEAQKELVAMRVALEAINTRLSGIERRLERSGLVDFHTERMLGNIFNSDPDAWDRYRETIINGEASDNKSETVN